MNWDLYRENRRHCRAALYRGLYAGWLSHNKKFFRVWNLDHAEWEQRKQPPDPVLEAVAASAYPQNLEWEGSPAELAQRAKQAPECKRRPIAGGKQRGNNSLSPGVSRFVTHREKQGVSALHFPPKRWHNAQPQKEILRSKGLEGAAPNKQTAGNVRVY